mmetsp:Transcript_66397/g.130192  ORF Transcript_66397/g.130192 Transcript_66397/m.130192 type:complete len:203 (+) Transcript_66397:310-918(+)
MGTRTPNPSSGTSTLASPSGTPPSRKGAGAGAGRHSEAAMGSTTTAARPTTTARRWTRLQWTPFCRSAWRARRAGTSSRPTPYASSWRWSTESRCGTRSGPGARGRGAAAPHGRRSPSTGKPGWGKEGRKATAKTSKAVDSAVATKGTTRWRGPAAGGAAWTLGPKGTTTSAREGLSSRGSTRRKWMRCSRLACSSSSSETS